MLAVNTAIARTATPVHGASTAGTRTLPRSFAALSAIASRRRPRTRRSSAAGVSSEPPPYAARARGPLRVDATASTVCPLARHPRLCVLRRDRGNLLVYSVARLGADAAAIANLGGISRHYLNHRHEAMFAPGSVDGPLLVHKQERESGDSGEHRSLFTGDSIYLADGEWVAAVLESSDREAYIESLELLGEFDFDVLVRWPRAAASPSTPSPARRMRSAVSGRSSSACGAARTADRRLTAGA